jgi:hypothetical protein
MQLLGTSKYKIFFISLNFQNPCNLKMYSQKTSNEFFYLNVSYII